MQDDTPTPAHMTAESAVVVLDLLDRADVDTWVAGGWGVDALVGRASRPHGDLDLLVADDRGARARRSLVAAGFVCTLDELPTRFEMTHRRHGIVDLHPIVFDADGNARLELPGGASWVYDRGALDALGTIGTRRCRCLSAEEQLRLHHGYEHRDVDRADIALLRSHLAGHGPASGVQRIRP